MPLSRSRSERGAIFIHVALLLVVLMGFIAFVADYGMLMVARNQAQNTADAAALAGARSRDQQIAQTPGQRVVPTMSLMPLRQHTGLPACRS